MMSSVASSGDGTKLFAAVNGGYIYSSINSGAAWFATGAPHTNWLAIACSADGTRLLAVATNGWVYKSLDSGTTWASTNLLASSTGKFTIGAVASSADGSVLTAVLNGSFIYTDPFVLYPVLSISASSGSIILTWPAGASGFSLQEKYSGFKTPWADLPAVPIVTNNENEVILPMTNGYSFYRLKSN